MTLVSFPAIFSSRVRVVASSCPLGESERAMLEASGFELPAPLARAVSKRQEEFKAGRFCALQALSSLGHPSAAPLGIAPDYSALWPAGYVGSIAHSHGQAAAAVAKAGELASVGIDLEPVLSEARAANVRRMILVERDERTVAGLQNWSECERVTLVFSAKEAIYKCLRPVCGQYFGFEDAALESVDEAAGIFRFQLLKDIGGSFKSGWSGQGRFERGAGWIHTAMELDPL